MKKLLVLISFCFLFFSCASTLQVGPDDDNKTLVIGQIKFIGKNFERSGRASINGVHTFGIRLKFKDSRTGEELETTVKNKNGLFYFTGSVDSRYEFISLSYKKSYKKSYRKSYEIITSEGYASLIQPLRGVIIDLEKGKVANLGMIKWKSDGDFGSTFNQNFTEVPLKDYLMEEYPDSGWLSYEWEKISLFEK